MNVRLLIYVKDLKFSFVLFTISVLLKRWQKVYSQWRYQLTWVGYFVIQNDQAYYSSMRELIYLTDKNYGKSSVCTNCGTWRGPRVCSNE